MPPFPCYSITELAALTGIAPRTIRYYRQLRILSPPLPRSQYVFGKSYKAWGPQHVRELRKIRDTLELNRSLVDIRDMLHPDPDL